MAKDEYTIGQGKPQQPRPHGPGAVSAVEKPADFKGTWAKLIAYCSSQKVAFLVALACAALGSVLTLMGPSRLSKITNLITDGFMTGVDLDAVVKIAVTLVVIYCVSAVATFTQGFIMATATQKITKGLRTDVSSKINRVPVWFYNKHSFGDVLSLVTNDVDTIGQTLNQSIGMLVSSVTLFVGSLIMMLVTNGTMALAAILSSVVGFVLMMLIMSRSQKYFSIQQRNLGAMDGHIEEVYAGHNVVKAYNGERAAKETFDEINGRLRQSAFKSQFLSGLMMPLMIFVGNLGYVSVCVTGAALVLDGKIPFGDIVAFMIYVRLFTQPLSQMAQAFTNMQSAAAASERVFAFLEADEMANESAKTKRLENIRGEVAFSHVRFGYEDTDKLVIHDFSAEAKPGQKIAIVGPTGAGKTTMVNLLMRFHELQGGEICIDGVPTTEIPRGNVHEQFCMVLQDTWLFEGTIRENVVYCKEGVTDAEVERACRAVGIHHFIQTLPQGYDTVLTGETSLSAGQRQQLTIARAMVRNAPMLILDEATSSVDTRTELQIQKAMDQLMEGRTSFVIAHRLSTIKNADLILVMNDGDIVESGTHDELLARGGAYADLYNSQFDEAG